MCNCNGIFIVVALFFIIFCDSTSSECRQTAPCICHLPDGSYYNLTTLADKELLNVTQDKVTIYYKPCKNILMPITNSTCSKGNGVSLCMYDNSKNLSLNLGMLEETKMKFSDKYKAPVFEIHHTNVTSVINIVCAEASIQSHFEINELSPNGEYNFLLTSPYACLITPHGGLSTGSILLILLFVFSGLYFIGGAIVLKTLRGATGWEMMPNHKFWCELPALVRDGVVFTLNCCRADSYERI